MTNILNRQLVKTIDSHAGDWLEKIPVITGKRDGHTVDAGNGKIWVRFPNGQEVAVLNTLAPLGFDRHILIGKLKTSPAIWRVAEIREAYLESTAGTALQSHHTQHEFPNQDTVFADRKQIKSLSVLVSDAASFKVRIYGAVVRTRNGMVLIDNTEGTLDKPDLDLSAHVPVSGALYVAIESDETGALSLHDGSGFASPDIATFADVPLPGAGKYTIAFVMLYSEMTELANELIGLPAPMVTDYDGADVGYQIDHAASGTPLNPDKFPFFKVSDSTLRTITYEDLLALINTGISRPEILTDDDCNILFDDNCELLYGD